MNKSESKYFNTARLMDDALVDLLSEKEFEYITVKEICEKAGVNRSTFYLHYETVSDLLSETIEDTLGQFMSSFHVSPEEFVPGIETAKLNDLILINKQYLLPYLNFIREHCSLFLAAFKNPAAMEVYQQIDGVSRYVLMPIMNRFCVPESDQRYFIAYYIRGCMAIVQEWMKENCSDSPEHIAEIMIACIRPYIDETGQSAGADG